MKYNSKHLIIGLMLALIAQISCTPMDDYKKFITEKEIQYPGRIDSVVIFSGDGRVIVNGLFIADPKVNSCKIFWNSKQDSLEVPIARTQGVDTLRQEIKLSENVYSFIIHTYDAAGNQSVPVYATGEAYGQTYKQSIVNRLINGQSTAEDNKLTINWYEIEKTLGPISTEITYTSVAGITKKMYVPVTDKVSTITDYKADSKFSYRTLYRPDTLCVDTFYTSSYENIMPITKINKKNWELVDCSSDEPTGEQGGKNGRAWQIFDDDINTFWHSCHTCNPRPGYPHFISFDMKVVQDVTSFELTPRQDGGDPFKEFEIRGSLDGTNWFVCGSFTMANNRSTQKFRFTKPYTMRYVEVFIKNGYDNNPYNYLAEITLYRE